MTFPAISKEEACDQCIDELQKISGIAISDQQRDLCYYKVLQKTGDKSVCAKMKTEFYDDDC